MSNVPKELRYTDDHEYVRRDGAELTIGITDYAQGELGDVVFVSLPKAGEYFDAHGVFGTIEAVKAVSELFCPVPGTVTAVNDALDGSPDLVNKDPYGDGWMIRLRPDDPAAADALKDAAAYQRHIGE